MFFGSPEFAAASLRSLLKSPHKVVGVITQPDRPAGRGLQLEPPPVKTLAASLGIPLYQPEQVNSEGTYAFLESLQPEILVVVAYGSFLGEKLLRFCKHSAINVHPSLLPDLRGAAPIQWSVIKGYETTGVSTQFMAKKMDAGDVILQERCPIGENETSQDLHDRLKIVGAELLVKTLDAIELGRAAPRAQDESKVTLAPLLEKDLGKISFNKGAGEIHNLIRGLFPWPGAFTFFHGKRVKLIRAKVTDLNATGQAGSFWFEEGHLFVNCSPGVLELLELQPEGKRALLPREFENGIHSLAPSFDSEIK